MDLFHYFDRISRRGCTTCSGGCILFLGGANDKGGAKYVNLVFFLSRVPSTYHKRLCILLRRVQWQSFWAVRSVHKRYLSARILSDPFLLLLDWNPSLDEPSSPLQSVTIRKGFYILFHKLPVGISISISREFQHNFSNSISTHFSSIIISASRIEHQHSTEK